MKREAVQIGQHYHSAEGGYFGGPGPKWEVVSVAELNDGVTCARLVMIGDSDTDDGLVDILSETRIRRIPEDFALVMRTLILLNGLSHRLAPGRRLVQGELLQHLAAGAALR